MTGSNSPTSRPLAGLRVTVVLNWADLGGAEQNALTLARSLRDDVGADVEFLALTDRPGRAADAVRALGMAWRSSSSTGTGAKERRPVTTRAFSSRSVGASPIS